MGKLNIFKFRDNDEDDGTRIYDDSMNLICTRCGTRMRYEYSPSEGVDYAICPKCRFIEIESYDDEAAEEEYEDYWYETNDKEFEDDEDEDDEEDDLY